MDTNADSLIVFHWTIKCSGIKCHIVLSQLSLQNLVATGTCSIHGLTGSVSIQWITKGCVAADWHAAGYRYTVTTI